MIKTPSLEDVIMRMAQQLDLARGDAAEGARDLMQEVQSFIGVDPVLASLHKDYLNARALCGKLLRFNGRQDPMAEVAVDRLESALCAFETRLIELRQDPAARRAMTRRMASLYQDNEDLRAETCARESRLQHQRDQAIYNEYSDREAAMQARRDGEADFMMMVMLTIALKDTASRAVFRLRMAQSFMLASATERVRYAAAS